jgi:hypothetical protein
MEKPIKYKSIKVRESVYKELKIEAIKHDCSMLELIERMVAYIPHLKEGALRSTR